MRSSSTIKRAICVVALIAVVAACVFSLAACNRNELDFTDIYLQSYSDTEFDSYRREFTLPSNSSVYVSSTTSSDTGYINSIDAFVVCNSADGVSGSLSIVKCGDSNIYFDGGIEGMLFPFSIGVSSLRVKDGLIAVKYSNGDAGAFDLMGRTVLSRAKVKGIASSLSIDKAIKVLDGSMIAVNATYVSGCPTGYTAIFRPTTSGALDERGELVAYAKNDGNDLDYVAGFDGAYVSVVGNDDVNYLLYVPQTANGNPQRLNGNIHGEIRDNGNTNYYCEITYVGGGRFFVHEDWTVTSTADYMYYAEADDDYMVFSRKFYYPQTDTNELYTANADKVFLTMTNSYYGGDKNGIDASGYLNKGYMYAAYGIFIVNKIGYYDQYILDENLNVVMSLTGNFGVTISGQSKDTIGYFDLIMQIKDGYAYVPVLPSDVFIYDLNGKQVGSNSQYTVLSQNMSNEMIVAEIQDPQDSSNTLYGAFDLRGNVAVEFKYSALTAFRGYYALGVRQNDSNRSACFLVGKDGSEVELLRDGTKPFDDIAMTSGSNGSPIYKIGCYMYAQTVDGVTRYGVKNFNPNSSKSIIMQATMSNGCVLYAPSSSPADVFVFEKNTASDESVTYTVYRLTSSQSTQSENDRLGEILGGVFGGVAAVCITVVIILVIQKKRGKLRKSNDDSTNPKDKITNSK